MTTNQREGFPSTANPRPMGPRELIQRFVGGRVARLQAGYSSAVPSAVALMAQLRQCDPTDPGSQPALYELFFDGLPDSLRGHSEEASRGEMSVAMALHLYGVHQQGRPDPMSTSRTSLGRAVRRLAMTTGDGQSLNPGVLERFNLLIRTSSPTMRLNHLRAMVRQLRGEQIPLDYSLLARDLFDLLDAVRAPGVRLRWARDFHTRTAAETQASTTSEHDDPTLDNSEMEH